MYYYMPILPYADDTHYVSQATPKVCGISRVVEARLPNARGTQNTILVGHGIASLTVSLTKALVCNVGSIPLKMHNTLIYTYVFSIGCPLPLLCLRDPHLYNASFDILSLCLDHHPDQIETKSSPEPCC